MFIVLRLLLKFPRSNVQNDSNQSGLDISEARRRLRDGLRLIQTCQILRRQGVEVLFQENIVQLTISALPNDELTLRLTAPVLGLCDDLLHDFFAFGDEVQLFEHLVLQGWRPGEPKCLTDECPSSDQEQSQALLNVLLRFQRFELDVQCLPSGEYEDLRTEIDVVDTFLRIALFCVTRTYKSVLSRKHLKLCLNDPHYAPVITGFPESLDCCRVLECSSIQISPPSLLPDIEQRLTSQRPVRDTFEHYVLSNAVTFSFLPGVKVIKFHETSNSFTRKHSEDSDELLRRAMRYDDVAYSMQLKKMMVFAADWIKVFIHNHITSVSSAVQCVTSRLDTMIAELETGDMTAHRLDSLMTSLAEAAKQIKDLDSDQRSRQARDVAKSISDELGGESEGKAESLEVEDRVQENICNKLQDASQAGSAGTTA